MNPRLSAHLLLAGGLLALAGPLLAAECPSQLKSALAPIGEESPLSWAFEGTVRFGRTDYQDESDSFNNQMLLLGAEYLLNESARIYFEGGTKLWSGKGGGNEGSGGGGTEGEGKGNGNGGENSGGGDRPGRVTGQQEGEGNGQGSGNHWGFREFFFEYAAESFLGRAGLELMYAGDLFLLDERVLGGYASYDIGRFRLQGGLGTVSRDFSRMGKFCGNRHNYTLLDGYYRDGVADSLGESNLGFGTLSWLPGKSSGADEFAPANAPTPLFSLDEAGIFFLGEFGSAFDDDAGFAGAFLRSTLPLQFSAGLEAVAQFEKGETAAAYLGRLANNLDFDPAGILALEAGYLASPDHDEQMHFSPTFSNMFLGEVLKLDGPQAPLWWGELTHTLPLTWPVHAGVAYYAQIEDDQAREWDFEAGFQPRIDAKVGNISLFDHLTVRAIYSLINAESLEEQVKVWKIECRWAI